MSDGRDISQDTFTVVSFHAHPDDEALLTAGTLAKAAAQGHRVVLVVATDGEAGLAAGPGRPSELGRRRRAEMEESAAAIGAARCVFLGHPDSGFSVDGTSRGTPGAGFADLDPAHVATELADLLVEESADVLTSYDRMGGYGHRDHVQVHRVAALAARLAGTPVLLEATVDRQLLLRATAPLRLAAVVLPMPDLPDLRRAFTPRVEITHRIDVSDQLPAKLASLAAHASQAQADGGLRTLRLLLGLPAPVRRRVLGTEWFREPGRPRPIGQIQDQVGDIFASLRPGHGAGR